MGGGGRSGLGGWGTGWWGGEGRGGGEMWVRGRCDYGVQGAMCKVFHVHEWNGQELMVIIPPSISGRSENEVQKMPLAARWAQKACC